MSGAALSPGEAPGAPLGATLVHARADLDAFAVTGKDRLSWLNGLVTQEVGKLAPGGGAYALAVGKTGRILAELWLVGSADRVIVIAERARMPALREHLDKHLIMEDAEIGAPLGGHVVFAHGARAAAVLAEARAGGADGAMIEWTGQGPSAVLVDAAEQDLVKDDRVLLDDAAWEAQRIAWGVPRLGVDYDQAMPQEASLERLAVSFNKGCYLGQEAVFMLEKRGHARKKLARLAVDGEAELAPGVGIVLADGEDVGAITSATRAPAGGWLAIASMKTKHITGGAGVVVAGRAARVLGLAAAP